MKKSSHKGDGSADDTRSNGPDRFYSIYDVAEQMDVVPRTTRRWIDAGLLVAHRVGRVLRISERDFRAFLAAHRD